MRNKTIFISLALILLSVSAVAGYYGPGWWAQKRMESMVKSFQTPDVPREKVEAFARDFSSLDAARDPKMLPDGAFFDVIKGGETRIADFTGKLTLVNFWATWCLPCVVELPSLQKFATHYDGRINVVAIALEEGKTPKEIADFLEKRGVGHFAGYLDQKGNLGRELRLRGIPTTFVLSSKGHILYRLEGDADWTSESSREFFDALLMSKR